MGSPSVTSYISRTACTTWLLTFPLASACTMPLMRYILASSFSHSSPSSHLFSLPQAC